MRDALQSLLHLKDPPRRTAIAFEQIGDALDSLARGLAAVEGRLETEAVELAAARALTYSTLRDFEAGIDVGSRPSMAKLYCSEMVGRVTDRAIQVHGSLGMTDDTPLAALWRFSRMLRLADGPDEVHKMVLARRELNRWAKRDEAAAAGELTAKHAPRAI